MRLVVVLLALLFAMPALAGEHRFVLAIGDDEGAADQAPLRYAESEATEFAQLMERLAGVEDVLVLHRPDSARLREAVSTLSADASALREAGERVTIFVYVSGHARNGRITLGGDTMAPEALRELLQALPADLVGAFVDACTSGRLVRDKGGTPLGGYDLELHDDVLPRGLVLITSSGRSELAWESDRQGGSLFARSLLRGLRGAADADRDGRVLLSEAWSYLYGGTLSASLEEAGVAQRPHLDADMVGPGDVVLTELDHGPQLTFGEELDDAEIFVVDPVRGRALAELAGGRDGPSTLAVPVGRVQVYVRQEGRVRVHVLRLEEDETLSIPTRGGLLAAAQPLRSRGGALFRRVPSLAVGPVIDVAGRGKAVTRIGGTVGVGAQIHPWLRLQGGVVATVGPLELPSLQVREASVRGELAVSLSPVGRVQPLVGARMQLGAVRQEPTWRLGGWHSIEPPVLSPRSTTALGALGEVGLLVRLTPTFGFQLLSHAGVELTPSDAGPVGRPIGGLALTLQVTP